MKHFRGSNLVSRVSHLTGLPGEGLPYKNDGGACRTLLRVEKPVLVPLRVSSLRRSATDLLEY